MYDEVSAVVKRLQSAQGANNSCTNYEPSCADRHTGDAFLNHTKQLLTGLDAPSMKWWALWASSQSSLRVWASCCVLWQMIQKLCMQINKLQKSLVVRYFSCVLTEFLPLKHGIRVNPQWLNFLSEHSAGRPTFQNLMFVNNFDDPTFSELFRHSQMYILPAEHWVYPY